MSERLALTAAPRKTSAQAVRRSGALPAVLYGGGVNNKNVQVESLAFEKMFKEAGHATLVDLSIEGEQHTVLVRDVQRHPVKGTFLHVDFYQVRLDEVIQATIPLRFTGVSPAVKDLGGILIKNQDEVEVEALPQNLPHDIEVDITPLTKFDEPLRVGDLKVAAEVTIIDDPEDIITLVQAPRTEEELEQLTEEVKEEVEGVEGVKEEEKPEEAEAQQEEKKE